MTALLVAMALGPVVDAQRLFVFRNPTTGYEEYHGLASQGSEDEWGQSGFCGDALWWFTVEFSVDPDVRPDAGPPTLEIVLPHINEDREFVEVRATAEPGSPAELTVYQRNTCLTFTVNGLDVDGVAHYKVVCLDGC